jgi:hypothetical protein
MSASTDRTQYREVLASLVQKTQAKMPALNGRLTKAAKLALLGDVVLHDDGTATVYSSSDPTRRYEIIDHTCTCRDYEQAPEHLCQHRLAAGLMRKATELLPQSPAVEPTPALEPPTGIDPRHIIYIRQKPFIRYAGLLRMAYDQGLCKLETTFISVTAEVALAQCTATFTDGRVVTDVADSTPGNVGAQVKLHWPRLAATRAAARVLRNALALDVCSLEELGAEEGAV